MIEDTTEDKIIDLVIEALEVSGSHHKQWYLEEILRTLNINPERLKKEENRSWEPGIAP